MGKPKKGKLHTIAFHLNTLERGGAERVVSTLANRFAEAGYEVYVTTEWYGDVEFALDPRVKRVHVGLRESDEKKGRPAKFLLRIKYLRDFLKEVRPDVCVSFTYRPNYRSLTAALFTGVPVVISVRNNPDAFYTDWTDDLQVRLLFPTAAGCVFQTADQRAFFARYNVLQEGTRVIVNPINPKYLETEIPPYEGREKRIVQSSRLADFKNQRMLVDAFLEVHEKHPDYVLEIYGPDAGDGIEEALKKQIESHDAGSCIRLMGGSNTLETDLIGAQVFCLSSDYEGMPNVLLEAMAMGLPCVATDCPPGAPRELITDGENGLLSPVGDPHAFAERICRLIEDEALRKKTGTNAAKIRERANVDVIFAEWEAYLKEIVGDG